MKNPILRVNNLTVSIEGESIIKNLSFDVKKRDILTILGPNGAGKTVMLRALIGAVPYSGEISWEKNIKIGYVPQRLPMIKDIPMSVKEFLELKTASKKEIIDILNSVGMEESKILEKRVGDLSSGQFQRILVGWALIGNPDVLLFDEPFEGIDIASQKTIYNILKKLHKEKSLTIILVSHDLSVVYQFATNVLCINRKRLCIGLPKKILTPKNLSNLYGRGIKYYFHKHHD